MRRRGFSARRLGQRLAFALLSLLVLYPLAWDLASSLKSNEEILSSPWSMPRHPAFANYARAFQAARVGDYLLNSVLVTAASLALALLLTLTSAYAISRFASRATRALRGLYMAGLFIQTPVLLVPIFLVLSRLGLVDQRGSLVLVYAAGSLPFSVYLLSGYLASVPRDFEESAVIDGCGRWRTLFSVVAPLAQPGLVTVAVFDFFSFWNEYPIALSLIYSDAKKTLPAGISNLYEVQRYATDWGALFAGLAIVLAPTVLAYALTQKRLSSGIMMGGLKG